MNLTKSIDFLCENAGPVIQYRLRKEILNNISKTEEENLLEQIYNTQNFKLVESYAKPNGFIGVGMHGHTNWGGVRFHQTPLQDGESAAKLLAYYAIPKNHPLVTGFISAMRDEAVLKQEFSMNNSAKSQFESRNSGLRQGAGLFTITYKLQAMLGYGDDGHANHFQEISLDAFASMLNINDIEEITESKLKKRGNYSYHYVTEDKFLPCCYHLGMLAYTKTWRTAENIKLLANAINHMNNDLINNTEGILVKGGKNYLGPLGCLVGHFGIKDPFKVDEVGGVMQRRLLTELAMCGLGKNLEILRQSADNIKEALSDDGILRLKYAYSGNKYNAVGGYGEVFLEPYGKKRNSLNCDLTFWAVQFLQLYNTKY